MNESKISVRYAKALYLSASEEKVQNEVLEDLKLIEVSLEIGGFKEFLESPVIKASDKKKVVTITFDSRIQKLSLNFFYLILSNNREKYLKAIIRNYIDLYKEDRGIKQAKLTLPFPVSGDYHKKFTSILEKSFMKTIELEEVIDPEIIGGFILRVEDQQFDASVKTQLKGIKKELLETRIVN
jgi:F-type H+-transporting ATPase subunit delta